MSAASIEIVLDEPVGTIRPTIYGHFIEHLGACVDGGIWVGADSTIPNTKGIRDDVVAALRAISPAVIRWPGGCFADDYHWLDGVGPPPERPRRVNLHWGSAIETNQFGTHEFIDFCSQVGAEPYICGNVGSGSPREMRDWTEYCNFAGDSTLARLRVSNGAAKPFGVRYWGVGNESWGCGGGMTPEEYAAEYRRYVTYRGDWGSTNPFHIACGPNSNDTEWTRRFFSRLTQDYYHRLPPMQGFAAHYYCGSAGTATEYTVEQWYELLWKAGKIESLVMEQRSLMDEFDPEREIGLVVDEWGTWHPPASNSSTLHRQQNTIRDALVAALTLDIFNRHADKVVMANIAQTVNVLQSLLLTDEERMIRTPTYYVYDLYRPHAGAQSLRVEVDAPLIETQEDGMVRTLATLSGSASVSSNRLTLTLVNVNPAEPVETRCKTTGVTSAGIARVADLHAPDADIRAHNTFAHPATVVSRQVDAPVRVAHGEVECVLPPASVTRIQVEL